MPKGDSTISSSEQLPDFCQAATLHLTVIASVLLALILSFLSPQWHINFWQHLSLHALFTLWTSLTSLALLCLLRRYVIKNYMRTVSLQRFSAMAIGIIVLVTLCYSLVISFYLSEKPSVWFLLRNLFIAFIVSGVFFRYYYLRAESLRRIRSEAEARVQALQSRIRPHFLFNSLNTLANLAVVDPEKTEHMILDMADIFRASMKRSDVLIPFKEERQLCLQYLGLEKQRLGDRLRVEWQVNNIADNLMVPPLILQPLLENAVYHGVQKHPDGGTICIKGVSYREHIQLEITNPLAPEDSDHHKGNSMALNNIQQRLDVLYGNKGQLTYHQSQGQFYCVLKIPKQVHQPSS
ncbi:sensor histidine kinase [Kangiella sediminilitoris]|uniref:Histidine kinase internal region n=1 Tax=Kangiella sediminilitoris TaxID=1144748 RepID=A0A1B3B7S8_9GAMM|nr:histidine kinase [Kangiella sediminilitoris]AOE48836.1 Histidine kinase internal region [Kangiella sediminilitoris]